MFELLERLKRENLVSQECIDKCVEADTSLKESQINFLNILEKRNLEYKEICFDLAIQEENILNDIRSLIKLPEFKRAYKIKTNTIIINEILERLINPYIKITEGKKGLIEIHKELDDIIQMQIKLENDELIKIKEKLGEAIWSQFGNRFTDNKILEYLVNNGE